MRSVLIFAARLDNLCILVVAMRYFYRCVAPLGARQDMLLMTGSHRPLRRKDLTSFLP